MDNQLLLYKTISNKLLEEVGINVMTPTFYYENFDGEYVEIGPFDNDTNEFKINEKSSVWSPAIHNLEINQQFVFNYPSNFYGDKGVTDKNNKLGLGVQIYSKKSMKSITKKVDDVPNNEEKAIINFKYLFGKNILRGEVNLDFFIYLDDLRVIKDKELTIEGVELTRKYIDSYVLVIDGSGSMFPIFEVDRPGKPLWEIKMNWTDIESDAFDSSNVYLALNKSHPIYTYLYSDNRRLNNYLLNEIVINAMSTIVQKAIIVDREDLSNNNDNIQNGSVASVIQYWIDVFNIDTSSLEKIQYSFMEHADEFI